MAQIDTLPELTPKQQCLLAEMMAGKNVEAAALAARISRRTAYRWIALPAFKSALNQAQQHAFDDKLKVLRSGVGAALTALERNMSEKVPPAVQVRAASFWLSTAIDTHKIADLEREIAELKLMLGGQLWPPQ